MRDELRRIVADHGTPRRSEIITVAEADYQPILTGDIDAVSANGSLNGSSSNGSGPDAGVREAPCLLTVSTTGNFGTAPVEGSRRAAPARHDLIASATLTTTTSTVALVSSAARTFTLGAWEAGDADSRNRGEALAPMLGLEKDEQVLAVVAPQSELVLDLADTKKSKKATSANSFIAVTQSGMIRRLSLEAVLGVKYGEPLMELSTRDRLAAAFVASDSSDIVIVADDSTVLRIAADSVSAPGLKAGAGGIKLNPDAAVIGAAAVVDNGVLVLGTSTGAIKATLLKEFATQGRGGRGVLAAKLNDSAKVTAAAVVESPEALAATDTLYALKGQDDNPRKIDPNPVPIRAETTKRYLVPTAGDRPIHVLAPCRF